MKFFKGLWNKIKNPSIIQMTLAFIVGVIFIAVAVLLMAKDVSDAGACVCYALAAVSLVYIIYMSIYGIPKIKARTLELASRYEFTNNIVKNFGFRTFVISCGTFTLNILYVIYNGTVSIYYLSLWYAALAIYYLALCLIRGGLIFGAGSNRRLSGKSEREKTAIKVRGYIHCGIWLIVLSAIIVAALVRLTLFNLNAKRNFYLIYVVALYTTVRMVLAVRNIVKAKRSMDPVTQSLRNINLADALVSLLSLQTAMFEQFGNGMTNVRILTAATGTLVCLIIITMGIIMIANGLKRLNILSTEEENGKGLQ